MMPAQVHTLNGVGDDLEDPLFEIRMNAAVEQIDHVPLRELRNTGRCSSGYRSLPYHRVAHL